MLRGLSPQREGFEDVVVSLRRWIFGLGAAVLVGLLAAGFGRPELLGFCIGWALSLFALDHLAAAARRVQRSALEPHVAQERAVGTYLQRWAVTLGAILVGAKLGANPIASVGALLLLQAAIVCRSIAQLFRGTDAPAPDPDGPAPDPEMVG